VSASPALVQQTSPSRNEGLATGRNLACSPEMRLLIASVSHRNKGIEPFASYDADKIDWHRLLRLADVHGVGPMLCQSFISEAPINGSAAVAQLRNDFQNTAKANLLRVRELLRVVRALENRSISVVPYKGPALAAMIYGDVTLREFSDLDLLIRPADLAGARVILAEMGYVPEQLLSIREERKHLRSACEYNFQHRQLGILLELHWQILPRQFSLRFNVERMWSRLGSTALAASRVQCLKVEDLLVVLCAHAAKHLWTRLIWIADIAGLMLHNPGLDWTDITLHSSTIGAQRILLVSLSVVERIFSLELPEQLERLIASDPEAGRLAQAATTRLLEQEPSAPSPLQHHITLLHAREKWADRWRYACRTISAGVSTRVSFPHFRRLSS